MIDLHNHILPGVDDGPALIAEAHEMARQAVAVGTTVMAATPHRFHGDSEQTSDKVLERVEILQASLEAAGIPLTIIPGVEMTMKPDTRDRIESGLLMPLGGTENRLVLIEPPFERIPGHAIALLESIVDCGYLPLIAHPERNAEVQKDLSFLETCTALGASIQLTAGAILGKFGQPAQECARKIALRREWTILIASDAHDPYDRTPGDMADAMMAVAEWTGDEAAARRMVSDIPEGLLAKRPAPGHAKDA